MAVSIKVTGDNLLITIPLTKAAVAAAKPSASGKTLVIASTGGNIAVEHPTIEGLKLGLNLYVPNNG